MDLDMIKQLSNAFVDYLGDEWTQDLQLSAYDNVGDAVLGKPDRSRPGFTIKVGGNTFTFLLEEQPNGASHESE